MLAARVRARGIGLVAAIAAAVMASAQGKPWSVTPIKALMLGALGVVCINVAVFTINLLSSMREWRHSNTEEELAGLAIPAMRGELRAIGPRTVRIASLFLAACLGIMAGAIVAQAIHYGLALTGTSR